jgi:hypothetical protein
MSSEEQEHCSEAIWGRFMKKDNSEVQNSPCRKRKAFPTQPIGVKDGQHANAHVVRLRHRPDPQAAACITPSHNHDGVQARLAHFWMRGEFPRHLRALLGAKGNKHGFQS